MEHFKVRIADKTIEYQAIYPRLQKHCKAYQMSDSEPSDICLQITDAALAYEKEISAKTAQLEGRQIWEYPDDFHEISAACRLLTEALLDYDTLLMHGSCVAVDGQAYLFTAKSGTGKSTHVSFWKELLGDRAVVVNDDKPFLKLGESSVTAYGSPWCGKEGKNTDCSVTLKGICILERGESNEIEEISFAEVFPTLMAQIYRPKDKLRGMQTIAMISRMEKLVKFYRLKCLPELDAAELSYEAMSGR